jgi:iron complex outermembrane receptor protein
LTLLVLLPFPVFGQEAAGESDPWAGVEEMLVEGSGASVLGSLGDSASVVEFDAEDLVAQGTQDITDLADFTPNLTIVSPSAVTATLFIRGVGLQDFSANAAGAVAVYQDGVPINSPPMQIAQMFDVRNVGILRGPQGASNNRNASAGAIMIESRPPSLTDFSANIRGSHGSYVSDDAIDAPTLDYEGGIDIPIVQDVLGSRLSFRVTKERGYYTNDCGKGRDPGPRVSICGEGPGFVLPKGLKEQVGDRFNWASRGQFLFAPDWAPEIPLAGAVNMDFLASVYGSRRDQDPSYGQAIGTGPGGGSNFGGFTIAGDGAGPGYRGYQEPDNKKERDRLQAQIAERNPGLDPFEVFVAARDRFTQNATKARPMDIDPYRGDFNREGKLTVTTIGTLLRSRFEFENFQIQATSGFNRFDSKAKNDTDLTPDILFEVTTRNRVWQASQDLVATGDLEIADISWEAGGFFLTEDLEIRSFNLVGGPDVRRFPEQNIYSYGAFGGFEWRFLDAFTLKGGARYNIETKRFELTQDIFLLGDNVINARAVQTNTFKEPTGSIELVYDLTPNSTVYGKFNHGYKPGHFNTNGLDCRTGTCQIREAADKETIDAFEVGVNLGLWEDRMKLNAALFHYDYKDYQVFVFEDTPLGAPTLQVINANDARVLGAEAEMRLSPLEGYVPESIEGMDITLRGGWLESEFLDFQNVISLQAGGRTVEVIKDYSGNPLPSSPRWQFSGSVSWRFDLARFGALRPRYDFTWTDDSYFGPDKGRGPNFGLPEMAIGQRAFTLHNVRLDYELPNGTTQLAGWCRNVTDERYKTYAFDVSQFRSVVINNLGNPRSCGVDIILSW